MRTFLLVLLLLLPAGAEGELPRRALDLFDLGQELSQAIHYLDRYPELQSLDLSFNELSTLPPIPYLSGVRALDLSGNNLAAVPPALASARSLRSLDMRGNRLTEVRDVPWKRMPLTDLDLGGNQLTALGSLEGLENLESLVLSDNELTSLPPQIARLKNLRRLDLSRNKLTTLPPEIGQLSRLQELTLSGNPLTSLPPALGKLRALRRLDIEDAPLKHYPAELGQLRNLVIMSCPGCKAPIPDSFRQLRSLKWLYVGNLSPRELVRLEKLLPWAEIIAVP